jgi:hypothetical protein
VICERSRGREQEGRGKRGRRDGKVRREGQAGVEERLGRGERARVERTRVHSWRESDMSNFERMLIFEVKPINF